MNPEPTLDPSTRIHLEDLARLRRVTGWSLVAVPLVAALGGLAGGLATGLRIPLALGLFFVLVAGVLADFRAMLRWRERELPRLATPAADGQRAPVKRVAFATRLWPWLLGLVGLGGVTFAVWAPRLAIAVPALEPWSVLRAFEGDAAGMRVYAWLALAAALGAAVLAQYFAGASAAIAPEARGVAAWLRAGTFAALAGAIALFVSAAWPVARPAFGDPIVVGGPVQAVVAGVLFSIVGLLGVELLLRASWVAWMAFYDKLPHPGARVATDVFSLRLLFSRFNPLASLFAVLAEAFGIDLRGAWALTFIRRSLLPLAVGLTLVGWLSTAVVMVPATHVGLRERFGALDREHLLGPGLHFAWPWPLTRVVRVPVHRVRTIPIGFEGVIAEASMLWTVEHASDEYKLLLGDGRDLVTVTGSLHYKVADPIAYVYNVQNPDEALATLADRVLMQRTVGRALDDVLGEDLGRLARDLNTSIQAAADEAGLGIEVVDLTLTGLHPPVGVAADYQAVVAAQIDGDTGLLEAEAYRAGELPRAEGEAARLVNEANAQRVTRLASARGEAAAFDAVRAAFPLAPDLFVLTRFLAAMEDHYSGRFFHLLDYTIERDFGATWILE